MTNRLTWIVGFLSVALLGFELSLMRMLSYAQWYHFAYMIISIALLGFGISGTALFIFRSYVFKRAKLAVALSTTLCALSLVLSPVFLSHISFDPFLLVWEPLRFWQLLPFYLTLLLPFFFGAAVIGMSFRLAPEHLGRLYFSNLVGSGIGSLGAVVLMDWVHPNVLAYVMGMITLPAVLLALHDLRRGQQLLIGAAVLACLAVGLALTPAPQRSQYKSLSKALQLPDARIVFEKSSPLGVVEIVTSPSLRYAPGLSLSYEGTIPALQGVFNDGEWVGSIFGVHDTAAIDMLEHTVFALPFRLVEKPRVLVLGVGTGSDVRLALHNNAKSVTGVEMNKVLVELLADANTGDPSSFVHRADVDIRISEARSYLSRSDKKYDLLIVPILEGLVASAAGTQALFENYLFTVESYRTMIDHLTPQGILVVNSWMNFPPRGPVKTIASMLQALKEEGINNPSEHFAAIRGWSSFSALIKKQPLTQAEIQLIRSFCDEHGFDLVYLPGIAAEEVNRYNEMKPPYLYEATLALLTGREQDFFDRYPFSVAPATDNRPYFSHFIKWKMLPQLAKAYGTSGVTFFEIGYVLLLATFVQLAILSFLFIVVPFLSARARDHLRGSFWRLLFYFGGIGLGYMLIAMVMIQRFILFLGHPVYSVSVITGSMLIFSGFGSLYSERIPAVSARILLAAFTGIVILLILYALFLPSVLSVLLHLSFAWRVIVCILSLAPLAFLMGLPFPLGLRRIVTANESLISWAWGVNGYFSVIAASVATLVAIEFGFLFLSFLAIGVYVLAGVASRHLAGQAR